MPTIYLSVVFYLFLFILLILILKRKSFRKKTVSDIEDTSPTGENNTKVILFIILKALGISLLISFLGTFFILVLMGLVFSIFQFPGASDPGWAFFPIAILVPILLFFPTFSIFFYRFAKDADYTSLAHKFTKVLRIIIVIILSLSIIVLSANKILDIREGKISSNVFY